MPALKVEEPLPRNQIEPEQPAPQNSKKRSSLRRKLLLLLLILGLILFIPVIIVEGINLNTESRIFSSVQSVPAKPVGMVFGAGLTPAGQPSWMLADRLNAAYELYRSGKVKTLLLTGDNTTSREVSAMRTYLERRGVPANAIVGDGEGLRTYDSCYRAAQQYNVKGAILITQGYHLPRAIFLCSALGIDAVGYKAGGDDYPRQSFYNFREFLATFVSWLDINVFKPVPDATRYQDY